MPRLQLHHLHAHPDNANQMPRALFDKLKTHMKKTGYYPPLIVRPHPTIESEYELLDGHHRARALREIGECDANCEVWTVDDAAADVLLLTLNRLQGKDDPHKRAAILARLRSTMDEKSLLAAIPDRTEHVARLLEIRESKLPTPRPPGDANWPLPLTFFLETDVHARVIAKLNEIDPDRNVALARLAAE